MSVLWVLNCSRKVEKLSIRASNISVPMRAKFTALHEKEKEKQSLKREFSFRFIFHTYIIVLNINTVYL